MENFYHGHVKHHKNTLAIFEADEDLHKAVELWIEKESIQNCFHYG
jgi:hypothetical protein